MKPTVRDMMDPNTSAVQVDMPILDAMSVLIDQGVTCVPVVDSAGKVLGILSEKHCLSLVAKGDAQANRPTGTVAAFYDATAPQVSPTMDIYYVAGLFLRGGGRRFPVVDNGKLVGVITRKDLLRAMRAQLVPAP